MVVGVPREIKVQEYRVAVTPIGVREFVRTGHSVIVEKGAGVGAGFSDEAYLEAGAHLAAVEEVFAKADMIVKVKEPLKSEWPRFKQDQILYTYLHLAADKFLTEKLMETGIRAIAYETVETAKGHPLLAPMSEVAGRLALQAGADALCKHHGGSGVLLGGVTGVPPAKVVVIGGGTVGVNAAKIAVGMRARVIILDKDADRLAYLDDVFGGRAETILSNEAAVEDALKDADLVVGAVLLPGGAKAPHLVKRSMLKSMRPGSVVVDVAIDQGGCFETSRPTTHDEPTYVVDGIVHYCVANMPGAVARTSTLALTGATLPYGIQIANKGFEGAVRECKALALGVNLYRGKLTCKSVATAHDLPYTPIESLVG
ncbi:MAG: alanine dehydrogenase [Deltaproteobacteria bacterium]|nr:alanine dehydrogenase [Deltaproteobacteria bacterium]